MLHFLGVAIVQKRPKFQLTCQTAILSPCEQTNISGSITNKTLMNCKRKILEKRDQTSPKDLEYSYIPEI